MQLNSAATPLFVLGPGKDGYELGTYGVDRVRHTAWAALAYTGEFAVGTLDSAEKLASTTENNRGEL